MNKPAMILLVNELRSGRYLQARGQLKCVDDANGSCSFCCLGVLTDIYSKVCKDGEWSYETFHTGTFPLVDSEEYTLPEKVKEWANANNTNPKLPTPVTINGDEVDTIADLNDKGWTFGQIADYIEENYEAL